MKIKFCQDNFIPEGDPKVYPEFKVDTPKVVVLDPAKIVQPDKTPAQKEADENESQLAAAKATQSAIDRVSSSESLYQSGQVDADHAYIIPIAQKIFDLGIDYAEAKFREAEVYGRIAVINGDSTMAAQASASRQEGMSWVQRSIPIGFASKTYYSTNAERRAKSRQVLNKLVDSYKQVEDDYTRANTDYLKNVAAYSGEQTDLLQLQKMKDAIITSGYSNILALLQSGQGLEKVLNSQENYDRVLKLITVLQGDKAGSNVSGYDMDKTAQIEQLKIVSTMFKNNPDLEKPVYESIRSISPELNLPDYSFETKK